MAVEDFNVLALFAVACFSMVLCTAINAEVPMNRYYEQQRADFRWDSRNLPQYAQEPYCPENTTCLYAQDAVYCVIE